MKAMWALLLTVTVLAATAPNAAARQFKKPVYYKLNDVPYGIVTADFNHDGNLDLAVAEFYTGQVGILLGRGNGAFRSPRYFSVPGALALAVGDFNGDHKLDLAIVQYGGTGNSFVGIFLGDGEGNFHNSATYQLGIESTSIAVADFNGDGHLDVAVTNELGYGKDGKDGSVTVFFGKGDGTLGKPTIYKLPGQPYAVAAGDLNSDHHPDLVVAEDLGGAVDILMNTGAGKFKRTANYPAGSEADYIAIADLDHNGTLDLAVSAAGDEGVTILLGKGDGTFGNSTFYPTNGVGGGPFAVVVADFNRDGSPDLALACLQNVALLYGRGDGTFESAVPVKLKDEVMSLGVGDFNKDGAPDLAATIASFVNGPRAAVFINTQ